MPATEFPTLADHVRTLPAGAGRDRQLQRIINLYALTEAAAALHAAAAKERDGVSARVFAAADAVLSASLSERDVPADDADLERLLEGVTSSDFLAVLPDWIREMRVIASTRPDSGACTVASALELWSWTMKHFRTGDGARWTSARQAMDELAEALCPLIAARALVLEVAQDRAGSEVRSDLSLVYAAREAAATGATCAELLFGYRRHLVWDSEGCATCFDGAELDDAEALIPGIAAGVRMNADVVEADGTHATKRGPCVRFDGMDEFARLRNKLDGCLTGARLAKDRAAAAIENSMAAMTSSTPKKGRA